MLGCFPLSPRIRSLNAILAKFDPCLARAGTIAAAQGMGEQQHRAAEAEALGVRYPGLALTTN